jgi:proline dehydrogenase
MKRIFDNTEVAFFLKSDAELKKAHFLFKTMSNPVLVSISATLTKKALQLHLPIERLIKNTIFKQFCGGITEENCLLAIETMRAMNVYSILDYSVEGKENEKEFDNAMQKKLTLIAFAKNNPQLAFAVMKPTALGKFAIWQKVSENKTLTQEDAEEWESVVARFNTICKNAFEANIPILVDAEESWMQDAADALTAQMMQKYNKESVIVYNTIQCYRHDRLAYLKKLHQNAKKEGYKIGAKIVRGAYMEKEHKRAHRKGYTTPICESKNATDHNFNTVLQYIMENLMDFSLFVGSHNEESTYLTMQLMEQHAIKKNDERVWFGQLYGMSDHLSFNLGKQGYNVAKLVPFGPIREVIPYLIRRAGENTSVAGQTGRELSLIAQELKRRKL